MTEHRFSVIANPAARRETRNAILPAGRKEADGRTSW